MANLGFGAVIQGFFPAGQPFRGLSLSAPVQLRAFPTPRPGGPQVVTQLPPGLLHLDTLPGQPLPPPVQRKMEALFGTRFDDVRVHVGPQPAALGALAFTYGPHIYFAPGLYQPAMAHGQRLLGHELAHVVQQRTGRVRNSFGGGLALVQDRALEAEADRMGSRAASFELPVQAKADPGAGARRAMTGGRLPRGRAIQMKPTTGDLSTFSTTAAANCGGGGVKQFQALSVGNAVILTENSSLTTARFYQTASEWSNVTFTANVGQEIRTETGATRGRDIKQAANPKSAADKVGAGGLIVLAGGAAELHAEQSLLLVLADLMSRGHAARDAAVAGNSNPCASCLSVLRAFSKWYKLLGYGTLSFVDSVGQGRGVKELGRDDFPASADRRYLTFIDRYLSQKAGEFTGNDGAVTHLG